MFYLCCIFQLPLSTRHRNNKQHFSCIVRLRNGLDNVAEEGQEAVYFGKPNPIQEQCFDLQICPDLVLALVSLLGAAALLGMYLAATQNTMGKRKRRRSLDAGHAPSVSSTGLDMILVGNNYDEFPLFWGLACSAQLDGGVCSCCLHDWQNLR